jgi:predicted GH43/DUF377 family glycosyl hydrolase
MDWLGIERRVVELDKSRLPPLDRHYNGALVLIGERPLVVVRAHNDNGPFETGFWHACKKSHLWAVWLDPATYQPTSYSKLDIPLANCEDPRVVLHDGKVYVFFTHFEQEQGKRYDPYVAICNEQMQVESLHKIGLFGRAETEKNWSFFRAENSWMAVYAFEPAFQVVVFDSQWRGYLIHKSKVEYPYTFGELRGGTPPVLVDGMFWTWFHSVWIHPDANRRIYAAGAFCFQAKSPFAPRGCSTVPLIVPEIQTEGWVPHGRIVFPCGAVFDEKSREWKVSYGFNDDTLRIETIPHARVCDPFLIAKVRPKMTVTMQGKG